MLTDHRNDQSDVLLIEAATRLLTAAGGGVVVACRPRASAGTAAPTDVVTMSTWPSAAHGVRAKCRGMIFSERALSAPDAALLRGFSRLNPDAPTSWSGGLGGVKTELQWLVFDSGGRLAAWLLIIEAEWTPPLRRGYRRRLGTAKARLAQRLRGLAVEDHGVRREPGYVVVNERGVVLQYSADLHLWVGRHAFGIADHLPGGHSAASQPRSSGAGENCEPRAAVKERYLLRFEHMTGVQKGWLVQVSPLSPIIRSPHSLLTPAQQAVAHHAACGATCIEIADSVNSSVETVRSHLREIYRRLNVSCRVELAQAIRQDHAPM